MTTASESQTLACRFDDRNSLWRELGGLKRMAASVFFVDEEKNIADLRRAKTGLTLPG